MFFEDFLALKKKTEMTARLDTKEGLHSHDDILKIVFFLSSHKIHTPKQ